MSTLSICVFCSASSKVAREYQNLAVEVGAYIARNSCRTVYGGSRAGLMGLVADSALKHGGEVAGVIPDFLIKNEIAHDQLTELYVTKTMHERQMKMAELADIFLVLPGGLGTMAEFFEVITWKVLGIHSKPVYVLNAHGYWDEMLDMIKKAQNENFMHYDSENIFEIICDLNQINLSIDK